MKSTSLISLLLLLLLQANVGLKLIGMRVKTLTPLSHQQQAIDDALIMGEDRMQIVLLGGLGRTLVGYQLVQQALMEGDGASAIDFFPSLSLLEQTLRAITGKIRSCSIGRRIVYACVISYRFPICNIRRVLRTSTGSWGE